MNKSTFFEDVYAVVKLIPYGRVTSYGAIAHYLGSKQSSRMVGYALNNCIKDDITVPAHRVVNRVGLLTGKFHFGTETEMQEKLEKEGIKVLNNQIQNFEQVFWNPSQELE